MNKTTLEQWRMLQAVVQHGGFAQAADAIHKSQSTINYAVHKLQDQLGLPLLQVVGRKAQLTEAGELMLRRAGQLLAQAEQLEEIAGGLARGIEPEINIALGIGYLTRVIARFNSLKLGILAYNQGPGTIRQSISGKRPLSQKYYYKVLQSYFRLKEMHRKRLERS